MAYVMIVDDDEDFALATAMALRSDGHDVHVEVETGQAFDSMLERRPDLAILDVMFPESISAGFDLARTMRVNAQELKDVPILFLTALNQRFPLGLNTEDIEEVGLEANGFLEKPVEFDVLRRMVASLTCGSGPDSNN
ncbi:MAG: response regulator [Planctomycetes bacterium]|nr:response regulator [Planctomycetota bacterium]